MGHCYACNGDQLFPEIWLSSGEFSVGDQNINEDDLPLSEWLKRNGITKFDHLSDTDNFIHADDDLMTSGIPTDSDIIETILNKEDSDEDSVEFVEDTIFTKSIPTYSQAQDAVETLIEFFENSDTSGGFLCTKCNERKPTRPPSEIF
jgi:hypothetical protein